MRIKTKNDIHSGRGICGWFAYLPSLGVYPNCSDMDELGDIAMR